MLGTHRTYDADARRTIGQAARRTLETSIVVELEEEMATQTAKQTAKTSPAEKLFWDLIDELREHDDRIEEGTIMGGRCARVSGEFLGLVDYKHSGMVLKLPRSRVSELIDDGVGQPFAPAGKVFREWVAIPKPDRRRWTKLLAEAIAFVAPSAMP